MDDGPKTEGAKPTLLTEITIPLLSPHRQTCRSGYPSPYPRASGLFQKLAIAKADGSYAKLMNKLAKTKLLVIDELGLNYFHAIFSSTE